MPNKQDYVDDEEACCDDADELSSHYHCAQCGARTSMMGHHSRHLDSRFRPLSGWHFCCPDVVRKRAMSTEEGPRGVQLDLLCALTRIGQLQDEQPSDHYLWERIVECDGPRLYGHLAADTLTWVGLEMNEDVRGVLGRFMPPAPEPAPRPFYDPPAGLAAAELQWHGVYGAPPS